MSTLSLSAPIKTPPCRILQTTLYNMNAATFVHYLESIFTVSETTKQLAPCIYDRTSHSFNQSIEP